MSKVKSVLMIALLGVTTGVVVIFLLVTLLLPALFPRVACAPYGIRCAVGQANIRPHLNLTADLEIHHLTLFDPDGRGVALQVKRLAATLNIPTLILAWEAMPTEVRLDSPEAVLRQLEDGRWNLLVLAHAIRRHLRPTTRPAQFPLPRTTLTAGTLQVGSRRVTDVYVSLEPKPAPQLFEIQARAAVGGRSVQASGTVKNTLEGEAQMQVQEVMLRGALHPSTPHAALRFRLDLPDRLVTISDWSLDAEGAMARGTAAVRYTDWPPSYTLTIAQWRADLATLAHQLPLPWLSGLTGMVEGQPTTLQGHWPELPVGKLTAMLTGGGLQLAKPRFRVTGLSGGVRLQRTDKRLRLQAELQGEAVELLGQRQTGPLLTATVSVDTGSGDVTAEELRASIPGLRIRAQGSGRRWGRDSLDLITTELMIGPAFLNGLLHQADRGVVIKAVDHPSVHFRWHGKGRPWKVEIEGRSAKLASLTANYAVTLQDPDIAIQGLGTSWSNLEGTLAIGRVELTGRSFSNLRIVTREGMVVISARTALGESWPPSLSGEIALRGLSLDLIRKQAQPVPFLKGLHGSVAFALDKGFFAIKETAVRADGDLTFMLQGSLPLDRKGSGAPRFRLRLPWTDASALLSPFAALAPDQLGDARITGEIRADLEIIGQESHGTLFLRSVSLASNPFHLASANGMIPLTGRIGHASAQDQAPYSLTITSLRYGPIELRDFEASLAPAGNQVVIQRFAFQAWGGRASGWGTVLPLDGTIAITLTTERLSLRAICDAFPPIKGYISGRIDGKADLRGPLFALDKAQGNARFWAVDFPQERKEINRTLIEKLAGQRIRYFSLFGEDRRYDRGVLDVALKQGDLVFRELDISHTTLGFKDLDIKVSPVFNKIRFTHLLESIRKATERVKASAKPNP